MRRFILAWLLVSVAPALWAAAPPGRVSPDIARLIALLDHDDFAVRKQAMADLVMRGEEVLPAVGALLASDADPEVRLRAAAIRHQIHEKHWGLLKAVGLGASLTAPSPYGGYWLNRARFSRDGKYAVTAGGAVILFDLTTGKEEKRILEVGGARPGLSISLDGKQALTGHSNDLTVHLVDLPSLKTASTIRLSPPAPSFVALAPDGDLCAIAAGGNTSLWKAKKGEHVRPLPGHAGHPRALAFSADGKHLLVGTAEALRGARIFLFEVESGKLLRSFTGPTELVTSVAFVGEGKQVLASSGDGTIRVWDSDTARETLRMTHGGHVHEAIVTADGRRVVSGGEDCLVKIWDLPSGKQRESFEGHVSGVLSVDISPDGRRALSCDKVCCVRLWKLGR